MKPSPFIPDELLSAYIDRQISDAERRRVEMALMNDPALQHRLNALQAVVHLLQNAPAAVVPRPMTLSERQVWASGAYGPRKRETGFWLQWVPRLAPWATLLVAALFIFSLALPGTTPNLRSLSGASAPSAPLVQQTPIVEVPASVVVPMAVEQPAEIPEAQAGSRPESAPTLPADSQTALAPALEAAQAPLSVKTTEGQVAIQEHEGAEKNATAHEIKGLQVEKSPSEDVASTSPHRVILTPLSWFLGALLILLIFLTWRVTFTSRRK